MTRFCKPGAVLKASSNRFSTAAFCPCRVGVRIRFVTLKLKSGSIERKVLINLMLSGSPGSASQIEKWLKHPIYPRKLSQPLQTLFFLKVRLKRSQDHVEPRSNLMIAPGGV